MLISQILPVMSIYRLPQGQFRCSGHIINRPQNISEFATVVPRRPGDLDLILLKKGDSPISLRDLRVCRSVVVNALLWLKQNNKYYRKIIIENDALKLLPEDGQLTHLTTVMMKMRIDDDDQSTAKGQ